MVTLNDEKDISTYVIYCVDMFRPYSNASAGVSSPGATPESASPGVGLRSAQYTRGGAVYQADGGTICTYKVCHCQVFVIHSNTMDHVTCIHATCNGSCNDINVGYTC